MKFLKSKNELDNNAGFLKKLFKYILDIIIDTIIIIIIVVFVRSFIVSPFQVNWSSMNNTFYNNDYVFIEKLSYRFSQPKFWDIIIFEPPIPRIHQLKWIQCFIAHLNSFSLRSDVCNASDFFIKRIIWVPWDVIKIENWWVYRNWELLDESIYLNNENNWNTYLPQFQNQKEFLVPDSSVFVLWDNRTGSSDSRFWRTIFWENKPFVSFDKIQWKFFFRLFSPNAIFN